MTLRPRTIVARKLRRDATDAERRLWRALREAALPEKFRRQHPIGHRIADFACPAAKLVIELDGGQHATECDEDAARSAELAAHGYRVVRFWNNEVTDNLDGVLQRIRHELGTPPPPPTPPPPRAEGLGEVGARPHETKPPQGPHLMPRPPKQIAALKHEAAKRRNIPTAEMESFFRREEDSVEFPPHPDPLRPGGEGVPPPPLGAEGLGEVGDPPA